MHAIPEGVVLIILAIGGAGCYLFWWFDGHHDSYVEDDD
jgi:hypothetical protein